jgi:hypothetical protein
MNRRSFLSSLLIVPAVIRSKALPTAEILPWPKAKNAFVSSPMPRLLDPGLAKIYDYEYKKFGLGFRVSKEALQNDLYHTLNLRRP